jgi:acetyl esterase/lipase
MKLLHFLLAVLLPLTAFAADPVEIERDVEYGRAGGVSLKLDILKPAKTDKADDKNQPAAETQIEPAEKNETKKKEDSNIEKRRAAVIFIHGGSWQYGDKSEGIFILKPLVATGDYVGFTVNYRLSSVANPWPDLFHDCKAAIRFVRANADKYRVDPDRIGLCGVSAGGHLVNMLGVTCDVKEFEGSSGTPGVSTRVRCVANLCGPTDLPNINFADPEDRELLVVLFGGPIDERLDALKAASPLYYVKGPEARDQGLGARDQGLGTNDVGQAPSAENTKTKTPSPKTQGQKPNSENPNPSRFPAFLHIQGSKDEIVNYETQAVAFHEALRRAGADSTLVPIENGTHVSGSPPNTPGIAPRLRTFFDKHLLDKKVEVSKEPIQIKGK